jgi:hypothetical protein
MSLQGEQTMFEVVIKRIDGETETYDALTDHQAEFIFFRAKAKPTTETVILNEVIELDHPTS